MKPYESTMRDRIPWMRSFGCLMSMETRRGFWPAANRSCRRSICGCHGRPSLWISNRVKGLSGIEVVDDHLRIGALTRHAELEASPWLRNTRRCSNWPLHMSRTGNSKSRHDWRQYAFADPAAELPACVLALDATIVLRGKNGSRRVPASAFFIDLYETARADDELVEAVEIPLQQAGSARRV